MIIGQTPTNKFCGATITAMTNNLLNKYKGALIQSCKNVEFFTASLTEVQKEAMFEDSCVFTVEPNYILRARAHTTSSATTRCVRYVTKHLGDSHGDDKQEIHKLAIPKFNLRYENPPSKLLCMLCTSCFISSTKPYFFD